jgi:hypothetical protein
VLAMSGFPVSHPARSRAKGTPRSKAQRRIGEREFFLVLFIDFAPPHIWVLHYVTIISHNAYHKGGVGGVTFKNDFLNGVPEWHSRTSWQALRDELPPYCTSPPFS